MQETEPTTGWGIEKQVRVGHCLQGVYNLERKKDIWYASGDERIHETFP